MLFGPHNIRQLCVQIVEANQADDDDKVRQLVAELQSAIRSHIQQTRVMAAHAVKRSFLRSESYPAENSSCWPFADKNVHDKLRAA